MGNRSNICRVLLDCTRVSQETIGRALSLVRIEEVKAGAGTEVSTPAPAGEW